MSFKDDLESLGYIIVSMITGTLPWKEVMSSKVEDNIEQLVKLRNPKILCQNLPSMYIL